MTTKTEERQTYVVSYRDRDPACPAFTWSCKAWDSDDALDQFHADGDDWLVLSVTQQ